MATNSELKRINKGEVFQVGEVWMTPRGTIYRVVSVADRQAILRVGYHGTGRITRRWYDATGNWTLRSEAHHEE